MAQFFRMLLTSIKTKFVSIWTAIYRWTSKQYVISKILTAVRNFFSKTLSVKPRHGKDYYGFLSWLVSKRLVYAILLVLGVLSLFYLLVINPVFATDEEEDGIPVYSYDSLPLRFLEEKVKIKAESGYIAYIGDVKSGACEGEGSLYTSKNELLYTGSFSNSKYNGAGKLFYTSGQLRYNGTFRDNIFEGEGILYRANGSTEYAGGFLQGLKEGSGVLYDSSNNKIYEGAFSRDNLIYSDFLGKSTKDVSECYTGKSVIYRGTGDFLTYMQDIDAVYSGRIGQDNLDESISVESVYVLKDFINIGTEKTRSVSDLKEAFGEPYYEGNTLVSLPEAVSIDVLCDMGSDTFERIEITSSNLFDDVIDVSGYDKSASAYIYTFRYEGLMYTFFCNEKDGNFAMYQITKE